MRSFFFPNANGTDLVFAEKPPLALKKKIERYCQFSQWKTLELEETGKVDFVDKLHGYIEDGKCYDNQYIFYDKSLKDYENKQKENLAELNKYIEKMNKCIEILEKLFSRIKKFRESKNHINRMEAILEKGYVANTQKVSGSKRQRRYKKNAKNRFLTEQEIGKYEEKIHTETTNMAIFKREIKTQKSIEDMFFELGNTPDKVKNEANLLNHRLRNFGDTVYLYGIFEDLLKKLDKDIYKESLVKYIEVLKIDEQEKVQKKKATKNKTRFYIDEDGNEHTIEDDVEQIIHTL